MKTLEHFKRMLSIFYLYAIGLIQPAKVKRLPAAQKFLRLEMKSEK